MAKHVHIVCHSGCKNIVTTMLPIRRILHIRQEEKRQKVERLLKNTLVVLQSFNESLTSGEDNKKNVDKRIFFFSEMLTSCMTSIHGVRLNGKLFLYSCSQRLIVFTSLFPFNLKTVAIKLLRFPYSNPIYNHKNVTGTKEK